MREKKLRVVIDTNIFISFLLNSNFARLDTILIEGRAKLLLSDELVEELISVLERPKFKKIITTKDKEKLMAFFTAYGELINVISKVKISRDPKDDFLLALSIDGKATHLITGDADLLELKKIRKTKILTIADFLQL